MSGNREAEEVLRGLVQAVVQAEEQLQMRAAPEEGTMEQFGGASLKVLKVWKETPTGAYAKNFAFVKLEVLLPASITTGPRGAEQFGEMITNLIIEYKPDNATAETRVGVTFDSQDFEAGAAVGLAITPIKRVRSQKIVETMELLSQSNRSPLEIQSPKLQVTLKYITPPSGSGKRRAEFGIIDVLESNLFDKRSRHQDHEEEEEEEEIGVLDLMDDAAEETDDQEDSDFELDVDGEVMEGTKLRPNIMKNEGNTPKTVYFFWTWGNLQVN